MSKFGTETRADHVQDMWWYRGRRYENNDIFPKICTGMPTLAAVAYTSWLAGWLQGLSKGLGWLQPADCMHGRYSDLAGMSLSDWPQREAACKQKHSTICTCWSASSRRHKYWCHTFPSAFNAACCNWSQRLLMLLLSQALADSRYWSYDLLAVVHLSSFTTATFAS